MEKEKVLEIESQEVFDRVAVRIKYQNFGVLKRGEFCCRSIRLSNCHYKFIIVMQSYRLRF